MSSSNSSNRVVVEFVSIPVSEVRVVSPEMVEVTDRQKNVRLSLRTIGGNIKHLYARSYKTDGEFAVVVTEDACRYRRARIIDAKERADGVIVRTLRIPADGIVKVVSA